MRQSSAACKSGPDPADGTESHCSHRLALYSAVDSNHVGTRSIITLSKHMGVISGIAGDTLAAAVAAVAVQQRVCCLAGNPIRLQRRQADRQGVQRL